MINHEYQIYHVFDKTLNNPMCAADPPSSPPMDSMTEPCAPPSSAPSNPT